MIKVAFRTGLFLLIATWFLWSVGLVIPAYQSVLTIFALLLQGIVLILLLLNQAHNPNGKRLAALIFVNILVHTVEWITQGQVDSYFYISGLGFTTAESFSTYGVNLPFLITQGGYQYCFY
jgi:hypothetical protein